MRTLKAHGELLLGLGALFRWNSFLRTRPSMKVGANHLYQDKPYDLYPLKAPVYYYYYYYYYYHYYYHYYYCHYYLDVLIYGRLSKPPTQGCTELIHQYAQVLEGNLPVHPRTNSVDKIY